MLTMLQNPLIHNFNHWVRTTQLWLVTPLVYHIHFPCFSRLSSSASEPLLILLFFVWYVCGCEISTELISCIQWHSHEVILELYSCSSGLLSIGWPKNIHFDVICNCFFNLQGEVCIKRKTNEQCLNAVSFIFPLREKKSTAWHTFLLVYCKTVSMYVTSLCNKEEVGFPSLKLWIKLFLL